MVCGRIKALVRDMGGIYLSDFNLFLLFSHTEQVKNNLETVPALSCCVFEIVIFWELLEKKSQKTLAENFILIITFFSKEKRNWNTVKNMQPQEQLFLKNKQTFVICFACNISLCLVKERNCFQKHHIQEYIKYILFIFLLKRCGFSFDFDIFLQPF